MTAIVASIQERRGTAAAWALANPILLSGQIAFTTDLFYGATDQQQFKVGDGTQTWSALDYMPIGSYTLTASAIGAVINGASSATPNDTDLVMSVDTSVAKKNTWTQIKAFLKTYFDTVYTTTSAVASQISTALSGYLTSATAASTYQTILGYTPENTTNKSSSYTASSTTTYANTKALVDGLVTKQDTLVSATNIKTVNSNSLLGSGNVSVGTILGTVGTTATFGAPIPYNNGTSNTVTSSPFLALYNIGSTTKQILSNTSTTQQQGYTFEENGQYAGTYRYGSAYTATYFTGTSLAKSNVLSIESGNTLISPIVLLGYPIIQGIGQTSTYIATRHDQNGWRQGTMADVHTANTVAFEVGGIAKFNNVTRLMTYSNASPTEGDLWKTATEFNMQRNSITEQIASKNDALLYAMSF